MKDRKSRRPPAGAAGNPAGAGANQRFHGLLAGVILCVLTLLAYSNSFRAGMILDNKGLLLQDPRIREATGAERGVDLRPFVLVAIPARTDCTGR